MARMLAALAVALAISVHAAAGASDRPREEQAAVVDVLSGDTLVLDRPLFGTTAVRLVGVQAPRPASSRTGADAWPLAENARRTLAELTAGRRIRLLHRGGATDRHRRLVAHVVRDDGLWLQGEMLRRGMVRVVGDAAHRARLAEMLAIEGEARRARRGLWHHPFYAVRKAEDAQAYFDSYQLVEGVVVAAARVRDRVYLNFGEDWRTDFTVSIAKASLPLFEEAGLDLLGLQGRPVRVRGWIVRRNGPLIEATHPEQIELPAAD